MLQRDQGHFFKKIILWKLWQIWDINDAADTRVWLYLFIKKQIKQKSCIIYSEYFENFYSRM